MNASFTRQNNETLGLRQLEQWNETFNFQNGGHGLGLNTP